MGLSLMVLNAYAFEINQFSSGDKIEAQQINQNFNVIKTEANDRGHQFLFTNVVDKKKIKASELNQNFQIFFNSLNLNNQRVYSSSSPITATDVNYNFNLMKSIVLGSLSEKSCPFTGQGSSKQVYNPQTKTFGECEVSCATGLFPSFDENDCVAYSSDGADGLWPQGADNDLIVESGETKSIAAGSIKDYNNVNIKSGGTLIIDGASSQDPTVIGVVNDFILNGTVVAQAVYDGGAKSISLPRGGSFSYTITQANGGAGGAGGKRWDSALVGGAGGLGTNGFGGGGGGGTGSTFSVTAGGAGGSGGAAGYSCGSSTLLTNGMITLGDGGNAAGAQVSGSGGGSGGGNGCTLMASSSGAGGGGGMKGKHGLGLYIQVRNSIKGNGTFIMSGQKGFNGGNSSGGTRANGSGGAGGGGAGGSGGVLKIKASNNESNYTVNRLKGAGGIPGSVATPSTYNGNTGGYGSAGSFGSSGADGSVSIEAF